MFSSQEGRWCMELVGWSVGRSVGQSISPPKMWHLPRIERIYCQFLSCDFLLLPVHEKPVFLSVKITSPALSWNVSMKRSLMAKVAQEEGKGQFKFVVVLTN
jgi:hypothetical protein